MNSRNTIIAIIATLSASLALAEEIKTVNGKEYKDATVNRVEPDGIVIKTESGITKIYFAELPKAVQERFHYDAPKAVSSAPPQPQVVRAEPVDEMGRVTAKEAQVDTQTLILIHTVAWPILIWAFSKTWSSSRNAVRFSSTRTDY